MQHSDSNPVRGTWRKPAWLSGSSGGDGGGVPRCAPNHSDAPLSRTLILATLLALAFLAYPAVGEAHILTRADVRAVVVEDVREARAQGRRVTPGQVQRHWDRTVRRAQRHNQMHRCQSPTLPAVAIRCVFPPHAHQWALRVIQCESTALAPKRLHRQRGFGRWAVNGQYIGIFQMGTNERATHGPYSVGSPVIVQVRSAHSLWRSRGTQPWSCR